MSLDPSLYAELHGLLETFCREEATPAQIARLDELVCHDPAARAFYVEYMDIHVQLRWSLGGGSHESPFPPEERQNARCRSSIPDPSTSSPVLGFLGGLTGGVNQMPVFMTIAAAMLALTFGIFAMVMVIAFRGIHVHVEGQEVAGSKERGAGSKESVAVEFAAKPELPVPSSPLSAPAPVARLARAADCRWAADTEAPKLGGELESGRKLRLESGLAEIVYNNGARVLLHGPATMVIRSAASAFLDRGSLTATVEESEARGFEIHTPGMKYTDLGTEFGVLVADNGRQEVHVFRGKVEVEESGQNQGRPVPGTPLSAAGSPLFLLTAHQGIRISPANHSINRIVADERQFVRALPSQPFPLFGTGENLAVGAQDPRWIIIAISSEPNFRPSAAVVAEPSSFAAKGSRKLGQWLSNAATAPKQPDDCCWTFRTDFDLSGFDPRTARIEGRFAVDDVVTGLRLNGKAIEIAAQGSVGKLSPVAIERGFVAGRNILDIVIENRPSRLGPNGPNCMGLCVQWKGTAQRLAEANR